MKTVLITGASSGIGRACALHLDSLGWRVYAGVRRQDDADDLASLGSDRLTPVLLDVTNQEQISSAIKRIEEGQLHGLVNNAGIGVGGPVEWLALDDWRWQHEVNVIGAVAITQAAFPLIRAAEGRFVFIGSIAGRVASPLMAPYCASKSSISAIADSLRHELRGTGMFVTTIEPGLIATRIFEKGRESIARFEATAAPDIRERYGTFVATAERFCRLGNRRGLPAVSVAEVVAQALTSRRPRPRYVVGTDAKLSAALARLLPDRARHWVMERARDAWEKTG